MNPVTNSKKVEPRIIATWDDEGEQYRAVVGSAQGRFAVETLIEDMMGKKYWRLLTWSEMSSGTMFFEGIFQRILIQPF